jgi:Lrp/AsnC family transcriptional regulator, regulator for asnA, asnC and gidA
MAHTPGAAPAPGGRLRGDGTARDLPRTILDDVAKQIIEQLQQDGRRSYAAIGKAVGLSEPAGAAAGRRRRHAGSRGD